MLLLEAAIKPPEKAAIVCLEWISSHTAHLLLVWLVLPGNAWDSLSSGPERSQPNQTAWPMAFSFSPLAFLVSTWWTVTGLAKSSRTVGVQTRDEAGDFQKQHALEAQMPLFWGETQKPQPIAPRMEEAQGACYTHSGDCQEVKEVATFHLQAV